MALGPESTTAAVVSQLPMAPETGLKIAALFE
jgi:hypothetical protein